MKFRYLFLIILLLLGLSVIFFTTSSRLKVLVLLLKGKPYITINNEVYNGVIIFKKDDARNLEVVIKEVEDEEEAKKIIDKVHPNFIISAVHKHVFEKILNFYHNKYEKFINIFPFYENPSVRNLNPSFEDMSSEVVKFLKQQSIGSVNITHDDNHITKLLLSHIEKVLKENRIEISKDSSFYMLVFNDVLLSEDEISRIAVSNKKSEGIIVSVYPLRFYEVYGKYINDFYTVYPNYFFTEKGKEFVRKYKKVFKCYPNWAAVLVYDALSMIDKYGKEASKIVRYSGVAGEYNFSKSDNLFVINKFKDVKVR